MRVSLFATAALGVAVTVGSAAAEDPVGRYQMIMVQNERSGSSALILDTRDGHLWQWTESRNQRLSKEWVAYIGKLEPRQK